MHWSSRWTGKDSPPKLDSPAASSPEGPLPAAHAAAKGHSRVATGGRRHRPLAVCYWLLAARHLPAMNRDSGLENRNSRTVNRQLKIGNPESRIPSSLCLARHSSLATRHCFFIAAWARHFISSGGTSSTCVAIPQSVRGRGGRARWGAPRPRPCRTTSRLGARHYVLLTNQ